MVVFLLFLHCLTKYSAYQRDIYSTNVRTLHQYVPRCSKDFICSDSLEVSSAIVLSAIHKFECLNHKTKRAICKLCRLSVTIELFLQCLATNVNPITTFKKRRREHESRPPESKRKYTPKNPCSRCGKGITARSRAVSCDSCGQWTHNICASVFSR